MGRPRCRGRAAPCRQLGSGVKSAAGGKFFFSTVNMAEIADIPAYLRKCFREEHKRVFDKLNTLFRVSAAFAGTMDAIAFWNSMLVCLAEPARELNFDFRDVITLTCSHTVPIPYYDGALPYLADLFGEDVFHYPMVAGDFTHMLRDDRRQITWAQAAASVRKAVSHLFKNGWEGFVITAHAGCLHASAVINMGTGPSADQRTQAAKTADGMYHRFMGEMPRILQMQTQYLPRANVGASWRFSHGRRAVTVLAAAASLRLASIRGPGFAAWSEPKARSFCMVNVLQARPCNARRMAEGAKTLPRRRTPEMWPHEMHHQARMHCSRAARKLEEACMLHNSGGINDNPGFRLHHLQVVQAWRDGLQQLLVGRIWLELQVTAALPQQRCTRRGQAQAQGHIQSYVYASLWSEIAKPAGYHGPQTSVPRRS